MCGLGSSDLPPHPGDSEAPEDTSPRTEQESISNYCMEKSHGGALAAFSSEVMEQSSLYSGQGRELGGAHKDFPCQKQSGAGLRLRGSSG